MKNWTVGHHSVDVRRRDARGVPVLCEKIFFELFVVGTRIVESIVGRHGESRQARERALHTFSANKQARSKCISLIAGRDIR